MSKNLTSKLVSKKSLKEVKSTLNSASEFNKKVEETKNYITENKYVESTAPVLNVLKKAANLADEYIIQPYGDNIKKLGNRANHWSKPITNNLSQAVGEGNKLAWGSEKPVIVSVSTAVSNQVITRALSILGYVEGSSNVILNTLTSAGQAVTLFEISKKIVNIADQIEQGLIKADPYISNARKFIDSMIAMQEKKERQEEFERLNKGFHDEEELVVVDEKINIDSIEAEMQRLEDEDEFTDSIDVEKELQAALAEDIVAELQEKEEEMKKNLDEWDNFELTPQSKALKIVKGVDNTLKSAEKGLQDTENLFSLVEEDYIVRNAARKGLETLGSKVANGVMSSDWTPKILKKAIRNEEYKFINTFNDQYAVSVEEDEEMIILSNETDKNNAVDKGKIAQVKDYVLKEIKADENFKGYLDYTKGKIAQVKDYVAEGKKFTDWLVNRLERSARIEEYKFINTFNDQYAVSNEKWAIVPNQEAKLKVYAASKEDEPKLEKLIMPGAWKGEFSQEEKLASQEVLNNNLAEAMKEEEEEEEEIFYDASDGEDKFFDAAESQENDQKGKKAEIEIIPQQRAVVEVKSQFPGFLNYFFPLAKK